MAYTVVNTVRADSIGNDALMYAGFVGSQDGTTHAFTGADAENGVICTMSKMCKFCGDSTMTKHGYARIFNKAAAETHADLYMVDTAEVGYTIEQQMSNDPRKFTNAAGRPVTARKIKKGDEFQISKDGFSNAASTNTYVEVDANGKLKFTAAAGANTVAEVLGRDDMYIGMDRYEAYIIRFTAE